MPYRKGNTPLAGLYPPTDQAGNIDFAKFFIAKVSITKLYSNLGFLKYFIELKINKVLTTFLVPLIFLIHHTMITLNTFLAIGAPQIILVVVVILLLFGGKKIPELMRGLGSGIKEFKDASKEDDTLEEKKES